MPISGRYNKYVGRSKKAGALSGTGTVDDQHGGGSAAR